MKRRIWEDAGGSGSPDFRFPLPLPSPPPPLLNFPQQRLACSGFPPQLGVIPTGTPLQFPRGSPPHACSAFRVSILPVQLSPPPNLFPLISLLSLVQIHSPLLDLQGLVLELPFEVFHHPLFLLPFSLLPPSLLPSWLLCVASCGPTPLPLSL